MLPSASQVAERAGQTPPDMANFIDRVLAERRSLQQALAELHAKYEREHDPDVGEMIRHGEAEILDRATGRTRLQMADFQSDR